MSLRFYKVYFGNNKFATLIHKNTRTCWAKQDQAGSYMWVIMINNLTKECNFEIVNLSVTRPYWTKLYVNSAISFVRVL